MFDVLMKLVCVFVCGFGTANASDTDWKTRGGSNECIFRERVEEPAKDSWGGGKLS